MSVIACVYNPSNEYTRDYIDVFSRAFKKFHSDKKLVCLSDKKNHKDIPKNVEMIPLEYSDSWSKGWFSKLELFRPDITEDILYTDLDNILLKPLDKMFAFFDEKRKKNNISRPAMIKDLDPRQERLQSAVMWIPSESIEKKQVWDNFVHNTKESPMERVKRADKYGDAAIIRDSLNRNNTDVIQDVMGKHSVISFHIHYKRLAKTEKEKQKLVNEAFFMCFHGKNRKPTDYSSNPIVKENFMCHLQQ